MQTQSAPVDLSDFATMDKRRGGAPRVSAMAAGLVGSEILRIAADVRALVRAGRKVCNLTVGDFDPRQFPIPEALREGVGEALRRGETSYPPSDGVLELREAVRRLYARELGLEYPLESVLVTGGARPVLYGAYRAVVEAGERVAYPLPSWNNNHYAHLCGARSVELDCSPENHFLPTAEQVRAALPGVRLLCLNAPLNPSGTAFDEAALRGICEALVAENRAREARNEKPVILVYDHVYWMLCAPDAPHLTPPALVPETARWTVFVDGISKGFAATGLRVGWAVGPVDVVERMSALLGHVGAWAPRAEQVATVALLDDAEGLQRWRESFGSGVRARLALLHEAFQDLRGRGLPVDSLEPRGAIYLAARIHPFGRRTPAGEVLRTGEDVRRHLLDRAGVALVPFQAFGVRSDEGWFRLSVGAVGLEDLRQALARLEVALSELQPA